MSALSEEEAEERWLAVTAVWRYSGRWLMQPSVQLTEGLAELEDWLAERASAGPAGNVIGRQF